jgi:hypothetical protein
LRKPHVFFVFMPFDDQGARAPVVPTSKVTVFSYITKFFSLKSIKKKLFIFYTYKNGSLIKNIFVYLQIET